MAAHYITLPDVIDEMLDGLLATGLYGDSREGVLENLVLDQVKRLMSGHGPMAMAARASSRNACGNAPDTGDYEHELDADQHLDLVRSATCEEIEPPSEGF
jgi:hypothetical protein